MENPTAEDKATTPDDEFHLPGLSVLRDAVQNVAMKVPPRNKLQQDGIAGMTTAVSSLPDGMANGLLAGVNPIYGLYSCIAGPVVGGLFSSTQLMMITATSASAIMAGQTIAALPAGEREKVFFLLVTLIGVFQAVLGLLGLGRLTRFVSFSVMIGFLTGISVLLIMSQLPTATGYEPPKGNSLLQTYELLRHLDQVHLPTVAMAALTLLLAIILQRTPLKKFFALIAIAIPSLLVFIFQLEGVKIVQDLGDISGSTPGFAVPSFSEISFEVITGAVAVALVILIQGAGVSQSVPNRDGAGTSTSRDFIAQGAANITCGFFRGLPVGGSLGTTAINVLARAQTRWACIFSGLSMAIMVLGLSGIVAHTAMPSLGAMLILAGTRSLKLSDIVSTWNSGWKSWPSFLAAGVTFGATLVLPIPTAVGIGVLLSAFLFVTRTSTEITLVELRKRPDGHIEEHSPPKTLKGNQVTVLNVYGNLFYAGARTLEHLLPKPGADIQNPVVILRLRGRTSLGSTLVSVLANYAAQLKGAKGKLYLTGVSEQVNREIMRSRMLRMNGPVKAFKVTPVLGASTHNAVVDAEAWLIEGEGGTLKQ
ncbi:SulP family inorganic anion transporter [Rufibacter glacialis]|uniref:SulP family inorganic anion transporter n=1 Tax=Rufibacter glacialis TaxID=1259555 RepID=A0A5M8QQ23_9BACT|nr:SulP family inorganic anion transporter [Rufibacter glacialis]KAA6438179.1 SulP family inorganic anion transporter [Rufibacter glacialis]GGK89262.1 sodium-independent anion transporter [Rufibacter glacialis]